jgi:uridine phosphorylase
MDLPLLEHDFDAESVLEPARIVPVADMPERAVLCFFGDVVREVVADRADARQVTTLSSEAGANPVWEISVSGRRLAVFQPGVGAPWAAAFLEEIIAMGCRRLVACGGAGALIPELVLGHAVVVDSAVRDEGTSHHYLPASRRIDADPQAVATLVEACDAAGMAHVVGRSWTTDAIYRETRGRVDRRVAEGCVVVEMEAAALLAVAQYREVAFGQILLAGDSLAGENWDDRGWMSARAAREGLFWVAAEAAVNL